MRPYPQITESDGVTPAAAWTLTPAAGTTTVVKEYWIWNDRTGAFADTESLTGAWLKLVAWDGTQWVDANQVFLNTKAGRAKAIGTVDTGSPGFTYVTGTYQLGADRRLPLATIPKNCAIKVQVWFEVPAEVADVVQLAFRVVWGDFVPAPAPIDGLVAQLVDANLNITTKQTIYTVPSSSSLVITKVIVRAASISLTTAAYGFGFNANADDVIASATHVELTGSTLYTVLYPKVGAVLGAGSAVFGIKASIAQGAAATVKVDVFGYFL